MGPADTAEVGRALSKTPLQDGKATSHSVLLVLRQLLPTKPADLTVRGSCSQHRAFQSWSMTDLGLGSQAWLMATCVPLSKVADLSEPQFLQL